MSQEVAIWQCERIIPSQAGAGRGIQDEVLGQLEQNQWPERDVFSIRLAVEEALVNAIKHGNQYDSAKQVAVICVLFPERFRIEITDEGPGFDPERVPDPTDPENLDMPCGRGLMLMKSFMTRVEFNDRGNRVVLEKDRGLPESSDEQA
jgi:serine/threonine-protein kinase RsbW